MDRSTDQVGGLALTLSLSLCVSAYIYMCVSVRERESERDMCIYICVYIYNIPASNRCSRSGPLLDPQRKNQRLVDRKAGSSFESGFTGTIGATNLRHPVA